MEAHVKKTHRGSKYSDIVDEKYILERKESVPQFGHIVVDEADYGAQPEKKKGIWNSMLEKNPHAFITYYSATMESAEGFNLPAPVIHISYNQLLQDNSVKQLVRYKLFGAGFKVKDKSNDEKYYKTADHLFQYTP